MAAPLELVLRMVNSGNTLFSPEQLDYYGGKDAILAALRKYDPNAQLTEIAGGGAGEGASGAGGYRLDYDVSKMPTSKMGTLGYDLRSSNFGQLKNPNAIAEDALYGTVTNSKNVAKPKDPLWTMLAPIAVGALAPMAGAALAGAGIGGTAGLTAGVTGSGLTGANALNLPRWLIQAMAKAPQTAGQIAEGRWNPMSLLPLGASAMGINPNIASGAMTLANLARMGRRP